MTNKIFAPLTTITLLLLPQLSAADDFLDRLNAEAQTPASSAQTNDIRIMDKVAAKDSAFIPKNKNEIEYRTYLKTKFHKTYLRYIKLNLAARELVYEQYAESSFPRIEMTQEAIKQFLK